MRKWLVIQNVARPVVSCKWQSAVLSSRCYCCTYRYTEIRPPYTAAKPAVHCTRSYEQRTPPPPRLSMPVRACNRQTNGQRILLQIQSDLIIQWLVQHMRPADTMQSMLRNPPPRPYWSIAGTKYQQKTNSSDASAHSEQ